MAAPLTELPLATSTFTLARSRGAVVVVVDPVWPGAVVAVVCGTVVAVPVGTVTALADRPAGGRVPTCKRITPRATASTTMAAARATTIRLMAPPPLLLGSPAPRAVPPSIAPAG